MKKRKEIILVGDFETTIYQDQQFTEVWASALVPINSEEVQIFHSIQETYNYIVSLNSNLTIYYHNLEFDGSFWLYFLRHDLKFSQAFTQLSGADSIEFLDEHEMPNNSFKYLIDDMGKWYTFTFKVNGYYIVLKDSLKLLPFSVKTLGEEFKTKHKKLDMVYEGFRYAGCEITDVEKEYIKNDVLVVKEALNIMFEQGHDRLTIGSCAYSEFKRKYRKGKSNWFFDVFPDLSKMTLDKGKYGADSDKQISADEYIRKSYKGGWCYVKKGIAHKVIKNGCTYDVNSLYPYVMQHFRYPTGYPTFWIGDIIPIDINDDNYYFFVRFVTQFKLKKNHLPTVQIKNNVFYRSNEWLESSDVVDSKGNHYTKIKDKTGNIVSTDVILTMTKTDFILFQKHYDLQKLIILDGCYFYTEAGIFEEYIEKYKQIKMTSTGAIRTLSKLMLNSLYGKMSASTNSSFKFAYEKEDTGTFSFYTVHEYKKQSGFIAVGSAITSYARFVTITAAQQNYSRFLYADTDSIHCSENPDDILGISKGNTVFGDWKLESEWEEGYYVRQKTYIEKLKPEYIKKEGGEYNIICAGMPDKCKELLRRSLLGLPPTDDMTEEAKIFVSQKREITDFDFGLIVPDKLQKTQIRGGTVLRNINYEMRGIL